MSVVSSFLSSWLERITTNSSNNWIPNIISPEWWNSIISFAIGAATVGILWFWQQWQQQNFLFDELDNVSWVEPWGGSVSIWNSVVGDFTNRIGELRGNFRRKRRSRWPWETIRTNKENNNNNNNNNNDTTPKHDNRDGTHIDNNNNNNNNFSTNPSGLHVDTSNLLYYNSENDNINQNQHLKNGKAMYMSEISLLEHDDDEAFKNDSNHNHNNQDSQSQAENDDDDDDSASVPINKQICIGSIFGLDVGGTLAKLVYFEQKPLEYDPISPRERHYAVAASAQAVCMARSMRGDHAFNPTTATATSNRYASLNDITFTAAAAAAASSSSSNSSGSSDTNSHRNPKLLRRRRSVSVGCLERRRQLRHEMKQQQQQQQYDPNNKNDSNTTRSKSTESSLQQQKTTTTTTTHTIPLHSELSELDLRKLKELRQESVPDDLHHYRNSVHFQTPDDNEKNSNDNQENNNNDDKNKKNNTSSGNNNKNNNDNASTSNDTTNDNTTTTTTNSTIKKSRSMFDLSQLSKKKAQALDRFYNFARRLDSYHGSDHKLSFYSRELGGEFHFIHFETRRMQNAMDLIRAHNLHAHIAQMGATGGGAHKFASQWKKQLTIEMDKQDELDSLVAGMQFVLSTVVGECYTFRPKRKGGGGGEGGVHPDLNNNNNNKTTQRMPSNCSSDTSEITDNQIGAPMEDDSSTESEELRNKNENNKNIPTGASGTSENDNDSVPADPPPSDTPKNQQSSDEWWWSRKVQRDAISYSSSYPYMLVTIGTGVSILRVDGPRKHERISGSTIGGGTYWGLIRLLTDVEDFDDVMRLADKGDPSKVDMMVGDIYGNNSDALQKLGLPSHIVASSFGKLVAKPDPAEGLKQEDLARALLLMVTNNIGQVAYLNAKLHKTPRIYFVGNFLRRNIISQRRLSYAIHYWSKGEMEALFLEHEGYFGALGAFILSQKISHSNAGFFQWAKKEKHHHHHSGGTNSSSGSLDGDIVVDNNAGGDDDNDDDDDNEILLMEDDLTPRRKRRENLHRRVETFGT